MSLSMDLKREVKCLEDVFMFDPSNKGETEKIVKERVENLDFIDLNSAYS